VRAVIEYWIDLPKNWRTVVLVCARSWAAVFALRGAAGSNTEAVRRPLSQGTMVGSGAQGRCEEVVSISAITGFVARLELVPLERGKRCTGRASWE